MSVNRYGAIKRLNKSNFIALLSSCSEDTLRNIFPVRKHDLLKLISDRLTKQELQDIVYNLHEIDTQAIISQHDIRLQQIASNKESAPPEKINNIPRVRLPVFADERTIKQMESYVIAYNKFKGDENKQRDLISVIRDKSKPDIITFCNNVFIILKQQKIPVFDEIHHILLLALSQEQQSAIRVSITALELL
jgi:hypothetical protein